MKAFREVKSVVLARRLRWLAAFLAAQAAPVLEVGFVCCLYLLIDPAKRSGIRAVLTRWGWEGLLPDWSGNTATAAIALAGVAMLTASVLIKYANEKNLIAIVYDSYVANSQALVGGYLAVPVTTAGRIGRERITSSIMIDCDAPAHIARQGIFIFGALFAVIAYVVGGVALSWQMLLVGGLVYGLPVYLSKRLYDHMQAAGKMKIEAQEKVIGYFTDILSGFERAKLDGLEEELSERSGEVLRRSQQWRIKKRITQARLRLIMEGLPLLGLLAVLLAGSMLAVELPVLIVFLVAFTRLRTQADMISRAYLRVREFLPSVRRYAGLREELSPAVATGSGSAEAGLPVPAVSKVEACGVSFKYEEEQVLDDIDFVAEAGDRVLIQGPSGGGKSTFLEVLSGLLAPDSGEVKIDGQTLDVELFTRVRPALAYAAPTVYLFSDSLRNNLAMGMNAGDEELSRAASLAGLDEVVAELPEGFDSPLGENGGALSLGQRQRVILARLYLRCPRLILLDEATSNLDPELERAVFQNLLSAVDDRAIVIVVAHRAPEGIEFDKRFVIERGKLRSAGRTSASVES